MGKALKTVATVATIVAGVALIGTGIGAALGGTMVLTGIASAATIASVAGAISAAASLASAALMKKPGVSSNATGRLYATLDPQTPRKMVFGYTAMATDVMYSTYTASGSVAQAWYHQVFAVASHEVTAIEEIWFDSELAWTSSGGAQGRFAGYFFAYAKLVGTSGNGFTVDPGWGANHSLTGCAQIYMSFKLTGNSKKTESPFASSVPSRITIRGRGARVPDIRIGGVSASDQTTWTTNADSGRNPALQLLFYLIGWRINGKLAVGRGIPVDRIDLQSFITAANICDESVALAAGGTERRYRADGLFSEADAPSLVIANLEAAMNGRLRDAGGKIALLILKNDLAAPVQAFTEADIIGDDRWRQTPPVDETFNVVRGRYVDSSNTALYQLAEYPEVSLASPDSIERVDSFELPVVQSPSQAQRLAKTRLQRQQYGGVFTASFNAKAWAVTLGDIVTLTHTALGWTNKLFRVTQHGITTSGVVALELREEHADIYAWAASEVGAVQAAAPTVYDPTTAPIVLGIDDAAKTAEWPSIADPSGTKPVNNATNTADPNTAFGNGGGTVSSTLSAINSNAAAISQTITDYRAADSTLQGGINTLNSNLGTLEAAFGSNDSQGFRARVVAVENRSNDNLTKINGIETTLNTPSTGALARIGSLESVTSNGTFATATRVNTVESNFNTAISNSNARIATVETATTDGRFATATRVGSLETTVNGHGSRITTVETATTDGRFATASSVNSLSSTVNGFDARITTAQNTAADASGKVNAAYTLTVNAGGKVTGFKAQSDGTTSSFDILADQFRVSDGSTALAPFTVAGGEVRVNRLVVYDGGTLAVEIGQLS